MKNLNFAFLILLAVFLTALAHADSDLSGASRRADAAALRSEVDLLVDQAHDGGCSSLGSLVYRLTGFIRMKNRTGDTVEREDLRTMIFAMATIHRVCGSRVAPAIERFPEVRELLNESEVDGLSQQVAPSDLRPVLVRISNALRTISLNSSDQKVPSV